MGTCYRDGQSVEHNLAKALELFKKKLSGNHMNSKKVLKQIARKLLNSIKNQPIVENHAHMVILAFITDMESVLKLIIQKQLNITPKESNITTLFH